MDNAFSCLIRDTPTKVYLWAIERRQTCLILVWGMVQFEEEKLPSFHLDEVTLGPDTEPLPAGIEVEARALKQRGFVEPSNEGEKLRLLCRTDDFSQPLEIVDLSEIDLSEEADPEIRISATWDGGDVDAALDRRNTMAEMVETALEQHGLGEWDGGAIGISEAEAYFPVNDVKRATEVARSTIAAADLPDAWRCEPVED